MVQVFSYTKLWFLDVTLPKINRITGLNSVYHLDV